MYLSRNLFEEKAAFHFKEALSHNESLELLDISWNHFRTNGAVAIAEGVQVSTVKFLNFGTPENFAVLYIKFKQRGLKLGIFYQNDENGKANSDDPDQAAPLGAV